MTRALVKLVVLAVLVATGAVAVAHFGMQSSLQGQLDAAHAEIDDLRHAADRLTATRRVAQLLVTDQHVGPDGQMRTTLLLEEYAAADPNGAPAQGENGPPISPLLLTIVGDEAHLDATVITFDNGLVAAGDPLRGRSVALFTRLFGNHQPPAAGTPIDTPDRIGQLDRGNDPRVTAFQKGLWQQFWQLAESPELRKRLNVRSAGGQGVWFRCKPDQLYTVVLQSTGGLTVSGEPLRGLYRDALHAAATRP